MGNVPQVEMLCQTYSAVQVREEIDQLRAEGIEVDDDNEPLPEDAEPAPPDPEGMW